MLTMPWGRGIQGGVRRGPLSERVIAALFGFAVCLFVGLSAPVEAERGEGLGFTTILGPSGEVLFQTGLKTEPGDRFLDRDNRMYEVTSVDGNTARARFVKRIDIRASLAEALGEYPVEGGLLPALQRLAAEALGTEAGGGVIDEGSPDHRLIGIYHTHSDESYKPTSGRSNEPWQGDIFQVGRAKSLRLRDYGLAVHHSYNRHDPHDGAAYSRSRRTAVAILKMGPDALFDVHRDTPPRPVYTTKIDGEPTAQILIVVGRQNPTMRVNETFAWALKGYADRQAPKLIRGIYYAHGGYNQDLFPRALLLEVGTTTNTLNEAQRGIRYFSNLVPAVMYGIEEPGQGDPGAGTAADGRQADEGQAAWQTAILLVGGVVVFGFAFILLNESHYTAWTERIDGLTRRFRALFRRRIK